MSDKGENDGDLAAGNNTVSSDCKVTVDEDQRSSEGQLEEHRGQRQMGDIRIETYAIGHKGQSVAKVIFHYNIVCVFIHQLGISLASISIGTARGGPSYIPLFLIACFEKEGARSTN